METKFYSATENGIIEEFLTHHYRICDDPECPSKVLDRWSKYKRHLHYIGDPGDRAGLEMESISGQVFRERVYGER